ncbi:sphingomyelin phosphodiesterase 5-like isoform X2 [Pelodiscus sinensis]|uniref:sphingomyelin phosphodiesterase 5-like isoform X2 n=1 Tax=Pelodiscus sinensis TaxID=13735 RepID=UPI003F6AAE5B
MVLRESPFPNRPLRGLHRLAQALLFPSYWAVDGLLDLRETTAEKQQRQQQCCVCYPLRVLFLGSALLLLFILTLPAALLGLLLWLPLQAARRPFAYKYTQLAHQPAAWELPGKGQALSFISANVCLLPSGLAKWSNLGQTQQRAEILGHRLTQGEARAGPRDGATRYGATAASVVIEMPAGERGAGQISASFPPGVDFLCLQEVFDQRAATRLCRRLSPVYRHILYDVGVYGLQGCRAPKVFNSGLFLASRHPLLAAQYHCYPNGAGEDALSAKGLLCVQVQLGMAQGQRIVGYLNCTHLHAPAGDGLEQTHGIFQKYRDPCRVGPRQDQPWAIGTMLSYLRIHEKAVSTPEDLKWTLEREGGRQTYLEGPILQDGSPDPSAPRSPWAGRRVDYILHRERPHPSLATTVETFSFITQLADCSDHVAVGLRLLVTPAPQ